MSLEPRSGSRGRPKRKGGGAVARWMQGFMSDRILRKSGKLMGLDLLFLSTVGRKSGERRETPVAWFPDGEDAWLIVASALGSRSDPDWYYNLAAHPEDVSIELPGQGTSHVTAEQLEGSMRTEAWRSIVLSQPRYAKYQAKTDRVLPVIRLTRMPDDGTNR